MYPLEYQILIIIMSVMGKNLNFLSILNKNKRHQQNRLRPRKPRLSKYDIIYPQSKNDIFQIIDILISCTFFNRLDCSLNRPYDSNCAPQLVYKKKCIFMMFCNFITHILYKCLCLIYTGKIDIHCTSEI